MKSTRLAHRRQRGISMIEILIALALGLLLATGVIQIYASNKQTYRATEASARLQESARFAMQFLVRDVRRAGYQGCAGASRSLVNTLNDTSSFLYDFNTAIQGFEATGATVWSPSVHGSITSPLGGSDVLTTRGIFDDAEVAITGQPNNSSDCAGSSSRSAALKVTSAAGLAAGDIVIAGTCERASVFQITSIGEHNLNHNTGGSVTPGNATTNLGACYAGSGEISRIVTRSFYIRSNASGLPALYRQDGSASAEELVEGVEDMQVLFGRDANGDKSTDQFIRSNDVSDWDEIVSVRIGLLLQSTEDNVATVPQQYFFNGSTETPGDRRLRREIATTIALRNRLP